jgi:DNA gyrase subunit A
LEVKKLETERENLLKEANRLNEILNNEELFNGELKNGWREVARKFGDDRRTKIITLAEGNDNEPIEKKQLSISFTNNGAVFVTETSTLYSQKRNGAGSKFKLDEDEYIVDNLVGENTDTILFFTSHGNFYHLRMGEFIVNEKQYLSNFINIQPFEKIVAAAVTSKQNAKDYIVFITKNGILKKSALSEYNLKRNAGATAIKLDKDDKIVSVLFLNKEKIGIASRAGQFIMITTTDINAIGRTTRGVTGMKLNEGDEVVDAIIINDSTRELVTVAEDGYIKRTPISEFRITGRATKGVRIQNTENLCSILPLNDDHDVLVNSSKAQIRLKLSDIPLLGRGTQGVKSIKLSENSKVLKLNSI